MRLRRVLGVLILAGVALAGVHGVRRQLGLELDAGSLQQTVAQMGVWGPVVYVGLVAFRVPLALPSSLLLVVGGLVFGTLLATLYGALGLTLSAVAVFLAARAAGRASVEARLPARLRPVLDVAGTRLGALFVALGTAYPFGPMTMYHLVAGITGMALLVFIASVGVGALGRSALCAFLGDQLLEGDPKGLLAALAVLLVAIALPLVVPRSRRWLIDSFRAARGAEPGA